MSEFNILHKALCRYLTKSQVNDIYQAFLFAKEAHSGQTRRSGESYVTHPVNVAKILVEMRLDYQTIIGAILHDVLEDTKIDKRVLQKRFGNEITELVDGVTKLTKIKFKTRAHAQAENFRKMMIAVAKDIRVILIKLADRLHNMRTLSYLTVVKRRRIARETLEIYAPIANRLGMYNIVVQLEDLGFVALYPHRYKVLSHAIKMARGNRKEILTSIEKSLKQRLKKAKFTHLDLVGREKHLYSIYRKMQTKRADFNDIMDVYAFRIIVDDIDTCYRVLGLVHNLYKPVSNRFKDFIAIPKNNGYQSLHTTLFGPYGVPIEIQIRTAEMDNLAENGIASHWLYKSDNKTITKTQLHTRKWIKDILQIQQSTGNSLEFIENVKVDLFPEEAYVFTPRGDIIKLPRGATAVDFAYVVHTEVGNHCVAAKINRRLVPISSTLQSGQTVEIIVAPSAMPSANWLDFVVTGRARSRIRHFLKEQHRTQSIVLGKHLLMQSLKQPLPLPKSVKEYNNKYKKVLETLNYHSFDDIFEQIGLGNQMPQLVASQLKNYHNIDAGNKDKVALTPLVIKGTKGVLLSFAKCCYPIPYDPIEGILTADSGIIVHRVNCANLALLHSHPEKCLQLRWEDNINAEFEARLRLELIDQRGLLANLMQIIANSQSNIVDFRFDKQACHYGVCVFIITVYNNKHLLDVIDRIKRYHKITKISRC